jgi:TolB-like protein/Flp pilus assembly protein TadD
LPGDSFDTTQSQRAIEEPGALNFWQELRRRRVYRLAGLYIIGAWLVIQVADILFPAWGVPDTALRYLFIAAAACFPVALIFSWFYDITPNGIIRTEPAGETDVVDLRLKRRDYILLATLLAIGIAIVLGSAEKITEEIDFKVDRRALSIAVLPFTNLDTDPDTGYFSDGITEEILHRLSTLGSLRVLASNSSFALRDSKENPSQISEKLGVAYLLQGSIRRDKDYVRITTRLIDEAGFQLWSETFDRKLEGIFAIQTEIASTVSSQILKEIVPVQQLPAGRTTANMEAYNEYLIGRAFFDRRTEGWREKAVAAFQRAIELDPGFASPYAGQAMAVAINAGFGPHLDEAMQLAEKAIELDPELAEAHAIRGLLLSFDGEHGRGAELLREAIQLDPSLSIAYNWLQFALENQGLQAEAEAAQERGLEIDPLNPPLVVNVANRASREGNFERAETLLLRLVSLPEPPGMAYFQLWELYDAWGHLADSAATAKQAARVFAPAGDTEAFARLAWSYANLGMTEDADYWKTLVLEREQDDLETLDFTLHLLKLRDADSALGQRLRQLVNQTEFHEGEHSPWTLAQLGMVNIQLGNFHKGSEQLEQGIKLFQGTPEGAGPADRIDVSAIRASSEDIAFVLHLLAFSYLQVGRSDDAKAILQQLTDQLGLENNALHYALMGDSEGALQALRSTMGGGPEKYYGPGKYYEIINEPAWAETIKAPEFQELLAEVKEEVDRQRVLVETADAEHDFRAEMRQLLPR